MIVGTGSGSGKTTITCAILQALVNRGLKPASFKCGPDYIDPMFHSEVIGTKSGNLDLFLCGEKTVKTLFVRNAAGYDLSVIEGVMGMYDGLSGRTDECSSNHLAMVTQTPEILVMDAKGMSLSAAAIIKGFLDFKKNNIKGVILNNITSGTYLLLKGLIEEIAGIRVFGYLPPVKEALIESRHLGLVTAGEITNLQTKLDLLASAAAASIDIDGLIGLAEEYAPFSYEEMKLKSGPPPKPVRVAVAMDKAFCFYYHDSLELLRELGAILVPFSPLSDAILPEDVGGLILGGGYPEEYAKELSNNETMLRSVKSAVDHGIPTLAECGGFMYLQESITDRAGIEHKMAGVLPGRARMTKKLSRFGYLTLTAQRDNLLCRAGDEINAHEFHYSDSEYNGADFKAQNGARHWDCIYADKNLFAGYPHLHLWGNPAFAESFVDSCSNYHFNAKESRSL